MPKFVAGRLVTPSSLRELATGLRGHGNPTFEQLGDLFAACADEIQSRDAEIDGLKRALDAVKGARS